MQVVGIDSYDHEAPFGPLLQDALALPIDGGNSTRCSCSRNMTRLRRAAQPHV
jgi:hypothetical protein